MNPDLVGEPLPATTTQDTTRGRLDKRALESMSQLEILESIRAMESTYKKSYVGIEEDHRIHLTRGELKNVHGLVSRTLKLRRIDPISLSRPHDTRYTG